MTSLSTLDRPLPLPPPRPTTHARRRPRPKTLAALSTLVVVIVALPLIFLLTEASDAGAANVWHLIWRSLTASLLWNTLRLTVVVTVLCAVIGTLTAYCVERTDLPGRHVWAVLVVIPFAIPDFVVSFGWSSLSTWVVGFRGAVLVMTLAVYPLVYIPVAASFRGADADQEEIARSLGASRLSTFFRVTMGQARRAILGGCLLVSLIILAEFGAFEILGYRTFTTEIFSEFGSGFDVTSACALSLVLVALSLFVMIGEGSLRGVGHVSRTGPGVQRVLAKRPLGRMKLPVLAGFTLLVAGALGVPVGSSIYWIFEGGAQGIGGVSLLSAALYTAGYSAGAGVLATLMALPVALLVVRRPTTLNRFLTRTTFLVLAMPGLVVALALSYFSEQHANGFAYQSASMLIFAYALMFFPLALVGVRASVAQAPAALEEVASSLGVRRRQVLLRVTLPLISPGLGAAFCLVFLSAVTELTATLILIPIGAQTLATQFWAYQQNLSYGQAAPFALVMIVIAAGPAYLLGRFFDRLPVHAGPADVPMVVT
ncbi:MAG: ABC-type transporter, integral rane subunit [Acidimicrobiaceae bacterium]|nr:ABC-type transporter, integral rane subunit [Acidimicrobiaceae bacterium]